MAGQILRNKKFILISITAAVICALYLIFGWRVSVNRLINLLVSVHVLGIVLISIYYLSCRYIWPEWTKKPFHRTFSLVLSAFLISFAAAIWGYHYSEFVQTLLEGLYRSSLIQTYFEAGRITAPLVRVCLLLYPVGIVLALILIGMERKLGLFRKEKAVQALLAAAYFIFLVSGLTYVSSTNSFQDPPGITYRIFWGGNISLVTDRLKNELSFIEDLETYGGFNYRFKDGETLVYKSGTGFYGSVLKLVQTATGIEVNRFITGARIFLASLLACLLGGLAVLIGRRKGVIASILFILPVPITFWIMGPARFLLWGYFLFFLPLIASIVLYQQVVDQKITFKRFCIYMFVVLFFVFLRGYDQISNLILSAAVPVLYYEISRKSSFRVLLNRCFFTCLIGLAAFGVVFALHFIQLSLYLGATSSAWAHFMDRTVVRASDTTITYGGLFLRWLKVPVFYLNAEHFLYSNGRPYRGSPVLYIHKWNSFGLYFLVFLLLAAGAGLLELLNRRKRIRKPYLRSAVKDSFNMAITGVAALAASWTWFLAKGHMATHLHQNGIMYMFPFGIVYYIFFGYLMQTVLDILFSGPALESDGGQAPVPSGLQEVSTG